MTDSTRSGSPEVILHYGIKGMKWGVYRDLKRTGKRNLKTFQKDVMAGSTWRTRDITESEYRSMSTKPVKLGKDFYRIAGKHKGDLAELAYVTKTLDDHTRYKAFLPPDNKRGDGSGKKFDLKVRTAKDVISPSQKARVDAYIELLGKDIPGGPRAATGRQWVVGLNETSATQALSNREIGLMTYNRFAQTQGSKAPLNTAYFNSLRAKGYNAVLDDADKGLVSNTPIILFPKESQARVTEVKQVTKQELMEARANMTRVKLGGDGL